MASNLMKIISGAYIASIAFSASANDYTRFVNPRMGSQSSFELSAGNTNPQLHARGV